MTESKKDTLIWVCFQFVVNQTRASEVNSQSWTFKITTPINCIAFHCICRPFVDTNSLLTTKPCNFDIKCQCNYECYEQHNFLGPSWGEVKIFFFPSFFFNMKVISLMLNCMTLSYCLLCCDLTNCKIHYRKFEQSEVWN